MTDPTAPTPQDADPTQAVPAEPTQHLPAQGSGTTAWTTWVPASQQRTPSVTSPPSPASPPSTWSPPQGARPWTPPPASPARPPSPAASAPATPPAPAPKPRVTYLPPPSGPNWGLVLVGIVFALVGAGVVANQLTGFQISRVSEMGPSVLVLVGLGCALLGLVGILTRRRRG